MHPYSEAYYRRELQSMAALKPTVAGPLVVSRESGPRPEAGYMYVEKRRTPLRNVPVMRLDGQVWMSLTPMEVQSSFMAIHLARGRVGTAGLGLGYFVQRVLDKPEVDHVIVYELRQEVLDLYVRTFGPHPKLELHHANARLLEGDHWDFFYADIYRHLLTPQAIGDMAALCSANRIGRYHWWSIEQAVLEVLHAGLAHRLPAWMLDTCLPFLRVYAQHISPESVQLFGCGLSLVEELEHHGLGTSAPGGFRAQQRVLPGGLPVTMRSERAVIATGSNQESGLTARSNGARKPPSICPSSS